MKQTSTILHVGSPDFVAVEIPMAEGFATWCVENQGKSRQKAGEYVSSLQRVGSRCWNDHLLGFFEEVSEAFESAAGKLYEVVGCQIYVRRELENQIEAVSWYASLAEEELQAGIRSATYNKWNTAMRAYCKYLEFLTYQYLERSGFGGKTEGNYQPDEVAFMELERLSKRVALHGGMVKQMDSMLTDRQLDHIQMEPFASMRKGAYDRWLFPKPFFPLADSYKEWLKSQPEASGTRYNYPSVLNAVYTTWFKEDGRWNALLHGPSLLSVEYVYSLRSAILLHVSEVRKREKEQGKVCSIQAGATAAVESYIRFLKSLLKK